MKQLVPSVTLPAPVTWPDAKRSGPDDNPKGKCVNRYRKKDVMNAVNAELSSANGICQNPAAASSVVKTVHSSASQISRLLKVAGSVHVELLIGLTLCNPQKF